MEPSFEKQIEGVLSQYNINPEMNKTRQGQLLGRILTHLTNSQIEVRGQILDTDDVIEVLKGYVSMKEVKGADRAKLTKLKSNLIKDLDNALHSGIAQINTIKSKSDIDAIDKLAKKVIEEIKPHKKSKETKHSEVLKPKNTEKSKKPTHSEVQKPKNIEKSKEATHSEVQKTKDTAVMKKYNQEFEAHLKVKYKNDSRVERFMKKEWPKLRKEQNENLRNLRVKEFFHDEASIEKIKGKKNYVFRKGELERFEKEIANGLDKNLLQKLKDKDNELSDSDARKIVEELRKIHNRRLERH